MHDQQRTGQPSTGTSGFQPGQTAEHAGQPAPEDETAKCRAADRAVLPVVAIGGQRRNRAGGSGVVSVLSVEQRRIRGIENGDMKSTESDVSRSLVDTFSRPTPALTRLIEHMRQNPELVEGIAASSQSKSTRIRDRQGRSTGEPNSVAGSTSRRESTKQNRRTISPGIEKARASVLLPLVVDYANGLTQAEIARKHGIRAQTLRKRLWEAGVNTRVRVTALSESEVKVAGAVVSEGASVRAVARRLGVTHTTLLRALKRSSE